MSAAFDKYAKLRLPFTPPDPVQLRVDLQREESERRVLMALGDIYRQLGGGPPVSAATYLFTDATDTGIEVAPAVELGAVVTVYNHGPSPVLIMAGEMPKWDGQDGATRDQGLELGVGGVFSTDNKVAVAVMARTRDGETSHLTVELQT